MAKTKTISRKTTNEEVDENSGKYHDEYRERKTNKRLNNALRSKNLNDLMELSEDDWY